MTKILHWLFGTTSPYQLWGFFPAHIWTLWMIATACSFFLLEGMGLARVHGMVPLTWYWRCLPKIIWPIVAALVIWHFSLVQTRIK